MNTMAAQLTEDNEDFADRERYHQSEIVKSDNFDDKYDSDWVAIDVSLSRTCCIRVKTCHNSHDLRYELYVYNYIYIIIYYE